MVKMETDLTLKKKLLGHKKPITSLSFNHDSSHFASSSEDHTIMVWHRKDTTRTYCFKGHTDAVTAVEYSPDSKIIASCSLDHLVRLWVPTIRGTSTQFKAHLAPVRCLTFSPEGTQLITGSNDKNIKLWNVATRQFVASFTGHANWIRALQFSEDGRTIISCSDDHTVRVWDVASGTNCHTFQTSKGGFPTALSCRRNSTHVAVATTSGSVRVYDIATCKLQQHYVLHDYTTSICWHPCANYFLTSGKDGKVVLVDTMQGRPLYTLKCHEGPINCIAFDRKGEEFIAGGGDKIISVWDSSFIK